MAVIDEKVERVGISDGEGSGIGATGSAGVAGGGALGRLRQQQLPEAGLPQVVLAPVGHPGRLECRLREHARHRQQLLLP